MRRARPVLATMVAAFVLLAGAASAAPGKGKAKGKKKKQEQAAALAPTDYIALADTLSQPQYPNTTREVVRLPSFDGEEIYLEIVRPDPEAHGDGPWPVILEASPYHGTLADRDGTRIFPDPVDEEGKKIGLTGYFAPRGYAVALMDLRGTGRSTGCLDHVGPSDAKDMKMVIEWLAAQDWSNGRVGMTGHSYVGSTPSVAAAQDPEGLVTIVPSAGLASMYDHQFNKGVPWLLQWVGPMYAYEALAMQRDMPPGSPPLPLAGGGTGDNFESAPNPQFGCGWQNSAVLAGSGQVTGQYELWHARRDWREGATDADIPVFMIHGANDNAARIPAAEWFFGERFMRPGDKVWIGQWDHGSTNGRCGDQLGYRVLHPTCRFDQFQYALHAWFDKHLKEMDVDTGPAVEAYLNGETPMDVTAVVDPEDVGGPVYVGDGWERPSSFTTLYPDATDGSLKFEAPAEDGSAAFGTTAEGVLVGVGRGGLEFASEPLAEDAVFLGLPRFQLNASVTTGEIIHLTTTLYREDGEGNREPMNFCAIQPQLRHGVHDVAPVVPGEEMDLPLQCFTMAHWVPAGQRLVLEVSTKTPHHATFGSDPQITVFTGPDKTRQRLPVVPDAALHQDVPLYEEYLTFPEGPAQPGIEGTVIVPAPGLGTQVEPITAAGFEFDSEEGFDNARAEVLATPLVAADLDLYLQREVDGAWETLTAAESGDLDKELLVAGRLPAGHYRIVVHNWAGGPQEVQLLITFFNQAGEAGEGSGGEGTATEHEFLLTRGSMGYLPQP